jgi:hypothetical protein
MNPPKDRAGQKDQPEVAANRTKSDHSHNSNAPPATKSSRNTDVIHNHRHRSTSKPDHTCDGNYAQTNWCFIIHPIHTLNCVILSWDNFYLTRSEKSVSCPDARIFA